MGAIVFATQFATPKKQGDGNDSETIRQQHGFAILCSDETLAMHVVVIGWRLKVRACTIWIAMNVRVMV